MQTPEWIAACYDAFGTALTRRAIDVRQGPMLRALAPMVAVGRGARTRLHMVGVTRLAEPADLLAADVASRRQLAETLVGTGLPLVLGRLPAESATIACLRRACRGRALCVERKQRGAPYIRLDAGWEDPEHTLSARRRADVRRARRRAALMGRVAVDISCPGPDAVDATMTRAMAVEAASWKGPAGDAMASDRRMGAFFRDYARRAAAAGALRVCFLDIGGRPAAMQIGAVHAGRFWVLKIGYDPAFRRVSPGTLLMIEVIRYARSLGLDSYELLGAVEPWTQVWTAAERPCVSMRVYPLNVRGAVALAADLATRLTPRRARRRGARDDS